MDGVLIACMLVAALAGGASVLVASRKARASFAPPAAPLPTPTPAQPADSSETLKRLVALEIEVQGMRTAQVAFIEECEGVLDAVDRKRRQLQGVETRLQQAREGDPGAAGGEQPELPVGGDRAAALRVVRQRLAGR